MTSPYLASLIVSNERPLTLACNGKQRVVKSQQDMATAVREMLTPRDALTLDVLRATEPDSQRVAVSRKSGLAQTAYVVPTASPPHPLVAFVADAPSRIDAARGCPLSGPAGAVFVRDYLAPLGLTKSDVMLTHVLPVAPADATTTFDVTRKAWAGWVGRELDRYNPALVVALGRLAKAALGGRAHVTLPHPAAQHLRKSDTSELARKLRSLLGRVAKLRVGRRTVRMAKAAPAKQIVYGAALDPYQFDSQDDWVPAWEVEKTAHDYLQQSRVVNLQHEEPARANVVESWLVHYPSDDDYRAAMQNDPHKVYSMPYGNQEVHSGTWMLGVKIDDPEVWAAVQRGDITAFSIGGTGYRTDVDRNTALPNFTLVQP